MSLRNLKLELSVALTNGFSEGHHLSKVKALMDDFQEEVGDFCGEAELQQTELDADLSLRTVALEYERCVINIDLVTNRATRMQYVNRFDLAA